MRLADLRAAAPGRSGDTSGDAFVWPDYGGACLTEVVPTLLGRGETGLRAGGAPAWLTPEVLGARQVVLLVLDGLGFDQLLARLDAVPALASMARARLTSVAPTTTATALSSIATGLCPADHGVLGYRIRVRDDEVLNVLRWSTARGDARFRIPPASIQHRAPFLGRAVTAVSRTEFEGTGFTDAHLPGVALAGWRVASSMSVEVARLLAQGETFIYAYYDGIDKVAHERGLSDHYLAELRATDRLVAEMLAVLPPGASLVITADHGQVEVLDPPIVLGDDVRRALRLQSGEGRFRWLHVVDGALADVLESCAATFDKVAVVATRDELVDEGLFGGPLAPEVAQRLGDVALIATEPVAFFDPTDTGEMTLVARHGAMTAAEVYVPVLCASA